MKPRDSVVNLEYMNGEEAIHKLTDMFGADVIAKVARAHEQTKSGIPMNPTGSMQASDEGLNLIMPGDPGWTDVSIGGNDEIITLRSSDPRLNRSTFTNADTFGII